MPENPRSDLNPVDMGKGANPLDAYKALWASVIFQTVEDFQSNSKRLITSSAYPTKRDCNQAKVWLKSNWHHEPGSFLAVCSNLDLDPDAVRKALFKK